MWVYTCEYLCSIFKAKIPIFLLYFSSYLVCPHIPSKQLMRPDWGTLVSLGDKCCCSGIHGTSECYWHIGYCLCYYYSLLYMYFNQDIFKKTLQAPEEATLRSRNMLSRTTVYTWGQVISPNWRIIYVDTLDVWSIHTHLVLYHVGESGESYVILMSCMFIIILCMLWKTFFNVNQYIVYFYDMCL